jgi:hypothetical protein
MNQVFAQPVWLGQEAKRPSAAPPIAYLLGLVLGAITTALPIALLGSLVPATPAVRLLIAAVAAAVIALAVRGEIRGTISPLPERRRQVPTRWLGWRQVSMTASAFGYLLGMGVWTLLHHASAYVVLVCLLLVSPAAALVAAITYGGVRGGILLAAWATSASDGSRHRRLTFLEVPLATRLLPYAAALCGAGILLIYSIEGM